MILTLTRSITEGHGFSFLVTNYRIIELLSSHGESRKVTDNFSCHEIGIMSRISELSNYYLSITRNRRTQIKFENSKIRDKKKNPCEEKENPFRGVTYTKKHRH